MGGIYLLRAGRAAVDPPSPALWFDKPDGTSYADFRDRLDRVAGDRGAVWERQMVLGPAPEYCAVTGNGPASAPVAATVVQRRPVFAGEAL
jgi:hypothetical protein